MRGTSDPARGAGVSHQELGAQLRVRHVDLARHLSFARQFFTRTHFELHLDRQRIVLDPFGAKQLIV